MKWCVLLVIVCVLDDVHPFLLGSAPPIVKPSLRHCSEGRLRTDDRDPVTGLSSRDRYLVKSSYEAVRKNPVESGVALLNLLFKNHPETLQLFPFRDLSLEQRLRDDRFRLHCHRVINKISTIVDAIDNVDVLIPILKQIGESHQPRKVTERNFLQLKDAMIELFSTLMKPVEIEAWRKTLDAIFGVITGAVRLKAGRN